MTRHVDRRNTLINHNFWGSHETNATTAVIKYCISPVLHKCISHFQSALLHFLAEADELPSDKDLSKN